MSFINSLQRIKSRPQYKVGLITQPPDSNFDDELQRIRDSYDLIQFPTILTDSTLLKEFEEYSHLCLGDPLTILDRLSDIEYYGMISSLSGAFVLEKMGNIELYGATVYHLPILPIRYSEFFDEIIVLKDRFVNLDALAEHAAEEGFPLDLESALIQTQRKHFESIYNRGYYS